MSDPITGGCHCGAVQYEAAGDSAFAAAIVFLFRFPGHESPNEKSFSLAMFT